MKYTTLNKHNRWIEGFEASEKFFKYVSLIGAWFIAIIVVYSTFIYLADFAIRYPEFLGISTLFLRVLFFAVTLSLLGGLLRWFSYYLHTLLYETELKKIEKIGEHVIKNYSK